ncbi:hypothetical protein BN59_00283 [Legionella massiliensis]|uniref:Uncharacterized protein n=1 Tax=Legionella massiliensis TaxID=1034943 RepID=A0A078KW91_9GAMM|nr:Dot/Icm T4SS effector PI-3-phosphatase SidP [Legionella massiliensis]CDZ76019.1 hypothetical protein BN59_00283 [Legionella massiliensis]CEE11757.1 hypothetical protein BN1094_00283 [Legionella massiliensis]
MGQEKTILRVPEGLELNETLIASLRKILGEDNFILERYSNTADIQKSYQRRADALEQAFLSVIDTLPMKTQGKVEQDKEVLKGQLKTYLAWCRAQCFFAADADIETYQKSLSRYTALLIGALYDHCDWSITGQGKKKKLSFNSPVQASNPEENIQVEQEKRKELAAEILNKAEHYLTMQQGRDNIATLVPMNVHNVGDLVLLWDKQLPPCSPETIADLEVISKSSLLTTPQWFRDLTSYQQLFFLTIEKEEISLANLKFDTNNLILSWQGIKETNSQVTLEQDLQAIATGAEPLPRWFTQLSVVHRNTIRALVSPNISLSKFEVRMKKLESTLTELALRKLDQLPAEAVQLRQLPYWYLVLPDYNQRLLKEHLNRASKKGVTDLAKVFSFLPSGFRSVPALSNFGQNQLFVLDSQGSISDEMAARLRFSHPASRDVIKMPEQIAELHTRRNLLRILKFTGQRLLLLQTLISPEPTISYFRPDMPDYYLDLQRKMAVAWARRTLGATIVSSNHPYNYARIIDYTASNNADCLEILKVVESFTALEGLPKVHGSWELAQIEDLVSAVITDLDRGLENYDERAGEANIAIKTELLIFFKKNPDFLKLWPNGQKTVADSLFTVNQEEHNQKRYSAHKACLKDLSELAQDYRAVLNSGIGSASVFDYNGRELFLSTQEDLMVSIAGGQSSGSCVSNKDRKWIQICHTNAAYIYRLIYKRWPKFSDTGTDRTNFVNIVARLYISQHGHRYAGQNAPDSDGIKTPDMYLPKDIAEAIKTLLNNPNALRNDDILASNNVVKEIGDALAQVNPGFSNYIFPVLRLSEPHRLILLAELKALMGEDKFWQNALSYWASFYKSAPDGISQIKSHIQNSDINTDSTAVLAHIFRDIVLRPESSTKRSGHTQDVYDAILDLFQAPDPEAKFDDVLQNLQQIKKTAFESSAAIMVASV